MATTRLEQLRDRVLAERANTKYVKHLSVKAEVEEGKVTLYKRDNDEKGSPWGYYRLEATVKGDFKKVVELLKKTDTDKEAAKVLMPDVKKVEVLSKADDGCLVHKVLKLPWPLSNRDLHIYAINTVEADGSVIVATTSVPGLKETEDPVRAHLFLSAFIVTDLGSGKLRVFRTMCMDPKGNIPALFVDAKIAEFAECIPKIVKAAKKM